MLKNIRILKFSIEGILEILRPVHQKFRSEVGTFPFRVGFINYIYVNGALVRVTTIFKQYCSAFGCPYAMGNLNKPPPLQDRLVPGRLDGEVSKKLLKKLEAAAAASQLGEK